MGSRNHFSTAKDKPLPRTHVGSGRSSASRSSWSTVLSSALSEKSSITCPSTANSISNKRLKGSHLLEWYIPRYVIDDKEGACEPFTSARLKSVATAMKSGYSKLKTVNGDNIDKENGQEKTVPSPLHSESKQEWLSRHTDDKVRSLPLPPSHKPKILQYSPSHANNLAGMFERSLAENIHYGGVPKWYHGFPMIQLPPVVPPPCYKPVTGVVQPNRPWSSFYNAWSSRPTDPYNRYDDRLLPPPPQSMFAFAGGPHRRHFSVAPDWRKIRHD